jgi:hypothetical protein
MRQKSEQRISPVRASASGIFHDDLMRPTTMRNREIYERSA